tara:strand:- start:1167 stop:2174 length:1008 start_codon:yes stop_codon:yes gene_type:complete
MSKKIFISVASYQDPLLLETLCSAYQNAENKDNLVFGVCEQADNGINVQSINFKDQIKYELLDPLMAKGPCWARARIQHFISNEDYFLQIDSHTIFAKNWDEILINYHAWLEKCLENNFVITGYPRGFKPNKKLDNFELNTSYKKTLGITFREKRMFEDGYYSMQKSFPANTNLPARGLLIAGGFIFARREFVSLIPYDPKFYFHGEELSVALRLYTNMWDVVHIPKIPLFHLYTDVDNMIRKLHWDPEDDKNRAIKWNELDKLSKLRLGDLINNNLQSPFGLGKLRSIEDFGILSGVDLINKKIVDEEVATNSFCFEEIESKSQPFNSLNFEND